MIVVQQLYSIVTMILWFHEMKEKENSDFKPGYITSLRLFSHIRRGEGNSDFMNEDLNGCAIGRLY